jgi:hypothetical protein
VSNLFSHIKGGHRSRVLERKFEPKRKEIRGGWRKFVNDDFHNQRSSITYVRVIKSRSTRCEIHAARMREAKIYEN